MAFLAAAAPIIAAGAAVAGTVMSYRGQKKAAEGQAALTEQQAADYAAAKEMEAKQYEEAALRETATAQRAALEESRKSNLLQSRALALAGASGGGTTDPTIVDIISDLSGEGAYRSAVAMYEGEERARGALDAAETSRYEGRTGLASGSASAAATRRAGRYAGMATIFGGIGQGISLYGKYGLPSTRPEEVS